MKPSPRRKLGPKMESLVDEVPSQTGLRSFKMTDMLNTTGSIKSCSKVEGGVMMDVWK
jgi:hypothetical protein